MVYIRQQSPNRECCLFLSKQVFWPHLHNHRGVEKRKNRTNKRRKNGGNNNERSDSKSCNWPQGQGPTEIPDMRGKLRNYKLSISSEIVTFCKVLDYKELFLMNFSLKHLENLFFETINFLISQWFHEKYNFQQLLSV